MSEPRHRYSAMSLTLHWLTAAMVLAQVLLITAHEATEGPISREFVMIHKSLGLTILVLTLARIGWRLANPPLPMPDKMRKWERVLARGTHVLFYVLMIGLPLGGWAASSAGGRAIEWFGLFIWPALPVPLDKALARNFMDAHEAGVKVLYVLLALHIGAALKHQFLDRDNVMHRMLPFIPRRP